MSSADIMQTFIEDAISRVDAVAVLQTSRSGDGPMSVGISRLTRCSDCVLSVTFDDGSEVEIETRNVDSLKLVNTED